ncbi:extracellular solute-binding protein, partial [Aeromonas salmonicida]
MKINKLTAVIMLSLGAGSLLSHGVMAAEGELLVWEDIKKSNGIEDAIKAFEAQYKVKVKIQEMPYAQQIEKLRLDGPAGIGPDVLVIPHDQVGGAVVQGLLSELKVDAKYMDSFTKPAVDAQTYEGKLYGIRRCFLNR